MLRSADVGWVCRGGYLSTVFAIQYYTFGRPANGPLISGQSAADLLELLVHTVHSSNFAVQILV